LLTLVATGIVGLALAVCAHVGFRRYRASVVCAIDRVFEEEYAESLAIGARNDLRQYWDSIRNDVALIVNARTKLPLLSWGAHRRLDEALVGIIPSLTSKSRKELQKGN